MFTGPEVGEGGEKQSLFLPAPELGKNTILGRWKKSWRLLRKVLHRTDIFYSNKIK